MKVVRRMTVCRVSSVAIDCNRTRYACRDRLALKGHRLYRRGKRSVTPGGTTDICLALKGRQHNLPPL
ncbi:MAG: hypothetical protein IKR48_01635, partial [Kiritimatiellae bacterium]|nr:hypothetical protein [Kiritimatiellia bacterium]